jgi:hypothetical protein
MASTPMTRSEHEQDRLRAMARRFGVPLERLVAVAGRDIPTETDEQFATLNEYLLRKNAEAYRRLA